MTTFINLINTGYSFYSHNWQLLYFGTFIFFCILRLIYKPSRFYVLLMLGFLTLLFEFEYSKHLIPHVRENVTELILVDPARRSFNMADLFFSQLFPIFAKTFGWFLIFFSVFFLHKEPKTQSQETH